ncbi:hypothetical protein AAL_03851 [Moelleriella libera RCEF 2490]|uniref:Uncharacterized protein n=1 Tax=Moelleriella libera RCEF 2490 TaxID=1081109 RepID=A0A162INR9_9HYPO|nr:hypothetical protein AAL_03851 [Moelleriella libera RCEF 2490]
MQPSAAPQNAWRTLTERIASLDDAAVRGGPNRAANPLDIEVRTWMPWQDFTYEIIVLEIFRSQLFGKDSEGNSLPNYNYTSFKGLAVDNLDLAIQEEEQVNYFLTKYVFPPVNHALIGQPGNPAFAQGSRCRREQYVPDWCTIDRKTFKTNVAASHLNFLPGETKVGKKWGPEMKNANIEEWKKPVVQVVNYMIAENRRYGYLITDKGICALRISRLPTTTVMRSPNEPRVAGLAGVDRRRQQQSGSSSSSQSTLERQAIINRQRAAMSAGGSTQSPGRAVASSSRAVASPSTSSESGSGNVSSGGSVYSGATSEGDEPYQIEYAWIPWTAAGTGKLTVKLTLWALAMMARNGESRIQSSYLHLNTWRKVPNGNGWRHVSSGKVQQMLSRNARQA